MSTSVSAGSVFAAAKVDAINQSNVVNNGDNDNDAWSTGANARAVHGVFFFFVFLVVAIERGNPAG